jgi:hypothetical protein
MTRNTASRLLPLLRHWPPARDVFQSRPRREFRGADGGRYRFSGGNWYRWGGRDWVVVGAPLGVFVPSLPPSFTPVWWNGSPYYYANDTYYVWNDAGQQYQVVAPPQGMAVQQSGFDLTKAGGVALEAAVAKRNDYFNTQVACLESRGYSVR